MDKNEVALSKEEKEVLKKIFEGKNNKEIAFELYLSTATVKRRVSDMLKKLGVKNRVHLAVYYEHEFMQSKQYSS